MDERKYKILIIDDDAFILGMYVTKFIKDGHEVETAKSGNEAISKIRDGYSPEIILIDIVLPDMNGLDLLDALRQEKLVPDSVCIMFTNQSSDDETHRARELGIANYLVKANLVPSEVVTRVLETARNYQK